MTEVRVIQQGEGCSVVNVVRFVFNNMSAAVEFAETCIECGDFGTVASIKKLDKEE